MFQAWRVGTSRRGPLPGRGLAGAGLGRSVQREEEAAVQASSPSKDSDQLLWGPLGSLQEFFISPGGDHYS